MNQKAPELLKQSGLKVTKQREAILDILLTSPAHLTAEDIYLDLKSRGCAFGLSTVYRTLSSLEEHHIVEKTALPGDSGKQYYEIAHTGHRHHLVCVKCKRCIVLDQCPVEAFTALVCKSHGFTLTGHSFEIFGVCPDCQN